MNIATKIAARHIASEIGKPQNADMIERQLVDQQTMRVLRDQYASICHGIDPRELRIDPATSNLPFAKSAAMLLTDEQRLDLIDHLLNTVDLDAPDLRTEAESILNEIGAHVRGEA